MGWDSNGEPLTPIACTCSGGDLQRVQLLSSHGADRGPVDPGWASPEDDLEPPLSSAEQCSLLKACAPTCAPVMPFLRHCFSCGRHCLGARVL